jgi:hypothetical protein
MVNAERGNAPGGCHQTPQRTDDRRRAAGMAPTARFRQWRLAMMAVGIVSLVVLAFLFRSTWRDRGHQLRPQWWGILGLLAGRTRRVARSHRGRRSAGGTRCRSGVYALFSPTGSGDWPRAV